MPYSVSVDKRFILDYPSAGKYLRVRNSSGGALAPGDVVIWDTSVARGDSVTTTTTQDDAKVAGVAVQDIANGSEGLIQTEGYSDVTVKVNGTTDISVGDGLSTFTTAKIAAKATSGKAGLFGFALAAYATDDSNGLIRVLLVPAGRQDASATVTYGTAGQMASDGLQASNAAGSTNAVSRVDHVHTHTADTPALVLGTTNAAGTAGLMLASDATVALFDTTVPTTLQSDDSAAVGTAAFAARRDHKHAVVNDAPADGSSLSASNAEGTSSGFSRGDHAHKAVAKNDVPIIFGTTDAAGTATRLEYDTAETVDATKLGLDETSRRLIISDYGDMGTDTTLAAAANPEVVLLDATAAEWFRFRTDLTGAILDVSTGNNYTVRVAGTTEYTLDASALTVASGNNIKFAGDDEIQTSGGTEALEFQNTASAVNHVLIVPGATGNNVKISAKGTGTDTNAGLELEAKGTGSIDLNNDTDPVALKFLGAAGGFNNKILDVNGNEIVTLQGVASAVNELSIKNAATGGNPELSATGGDGTIHINYLVKGGAQHIFSAGDANTVLLKLNAAISGKILDVNSNESLILTPTASAVNEFTIVNAATGGAPDLQATGGDTNIDVKITPKGTGIVNLVYAAVALGGGGTATLGTIGGSGPTATAQNAWLQVKINGTNSWLAFWR